MKIPEKDFKQWLYEKGYDYETHQDNMELWNEFITKPSKYTQLELELDVFDSSNLEDFHKTDEEINEAIKQKHREIEELEDEFISWKMENWRSFDLNTSEMELYYKFRMQRDNNSN